MTNMLEEQSHRLAVLCEEAFTEITKGYDGHPLTAAERFALECWFVENTGKEPEEGEVEEIVKAASPEN